MLLKIIMMPSGIMLMVVAMAVFVNGVMKIHEIHEPIWATECEAPVCAVAEKQAEGLARLRVLSDYIKETMSLMESVVASLDDEMMEVTQELSGVVGRRCHSRGHTPLTTLIGRLSQSQERGADNIVEATSDNLASSEMTQWSSSTLSGDVDSVLGTTHHTSQQSSTALYSNPHSTSESLSSGSQSSITSQSSTSTTSRNIKQKISGENYEAQSSGILEPLYVAPEQPEEVGSWSGVEQGQGWDGSQGQGGSQGWSGQGRGGNQGRAGGQGRGGGQGRRGGKVRGESQGQGGGQGWGGGQGQSGGQGWGGSQGRGESQGRGRGHGQSRGQGQSVDRGGSVSSSSGCRGVPVGSSHYVPNLDSWCAINCPRGFCPATHCVC